MLFFSPFSPQVCLPGWADCIVRGSLRQAYGIQGSACNDCLIGFFCSCVRGCFGAQPDKSTPRGCNTCMMQREITIRKAAAPQMVYAAPGQQVIGAAVTSLFRSCIFGLTPLHLFVLQCSSSDAVNTHILCQGYRLRARDQEAKNDAQGWEKMSAFNIIKRVAQQCPQRSGCVVHCCDFSKPQLLCLLIKVRTNFRHAAFELLQSARRSCGLPQVGGVCALRRDTAWEGAIALDVTRRRLRAASRHRDAARDRDATRHGGAPNWKAFAVSARVVNTLEPQTHRETQASQLTCL